MSGPRSISPAGTRKRRVRDMSRDQAALRQQLSATRMARGWRRPGVLRPAGTVLCACLVLAVLAGCGGGAGKTTASNTATAATAGTGASAGASSVGGGAGGVLPAGVVARVGAHVITRALLNSWMTDMVGEDFFLLKRVRAAPGLASEPANYPGCVAAAKAAATSAGSPAPALSAAQLTLKCEELDRDVKVQALSYLVSSYWSEAFDAKHGLRVSEAAVRNVLKKIEAKEYPNAGELERVIGERSRTLTQELFEIRDDLLQAKLRRLLTSGGTTATKALIAAARKFSDSAECDPDYIVEHCKGYIQPKERFASSSAGSPDQLITEITQ
jgi:hypothetical protein